MTFSHFNRRLHLYLGLSLLPWFLLYGVSSIPFSHPKFFDDREKAKGLPNWTPRMERSYDAAVPEGSELRPFGERIVRDLGLNGAWGIYRQGPDQINVYVYRPFTSTQVKYFPKEKKLVVEEKRFRWDHFFTGLHAKGGFEQDSLLQDSWGAVVDIVCLGFLLWIATGIYMWWQLRGSRAWGWVALAGGLLSFAFFIWRL